jgi:hypothetical protein
VSSALFFLLAACGGGPRLTDLRCRSSTCQSNENPLLLQLAVDFSDESGTLDKGSLDLRVNGSSQHKLPLADVFVAQGIAGGAKRGTLRIDDDLRLDRIAQGEQFSLSVVATNGEGHDSNEPRLSFSLHLGGP